MRDTWLGRCFGTRPRGLAPIDLLLLGALLVSLVLGATRLLPHTKQPCLRYMSSPLAPIINWERNRMTFSLDSAVDGPPIGVAATGFHGYNDPTAEFQLDDGELRIGDRLFSAHLDASRWTFVVLHNGVRHTTHYTIPVFVPYGDC